MLLDLFVVSLIDITRDACLIILILFSYTDVDKLFLLGTISNIHTCINRKGDCCCLIVEEDFDDGKLARPIVVVK